jgi:hypothetical protein
MMGERILVYPIAIACYLGLFAAWVHVARGTWSNTVSLLLLFAVGMGVPTLAGYAGYLWRKNRLTGFVRWEAAVCAAFPLLLLVSGGMYAIAK